MRKNEIPRGFVAFPSYPEAISHDIEKAIDVINSTKVVELISWKSLNVTGDLVIDKILAEIRKANFFMCDLTRLNPNVLFELGFAIALKKRIWVTLNTSFEENEKLYKKAQLLSGIGFSGYENSYDIEKSFHIERPYEDLENNLFEKIVAQKTDFRDSIPHLFFLKCLVNTNESIALTQQINNTSIKKVTDDPDEVKIQILHWYTENVIKAQAVIAHLLDEERANGKQLESIKYPFICGLAHGLNKPVLMLAHSPYNVPFDYKDLMFVHKSEEECTSTFSKWISQIEQKHKEILEQSKQRKRQEKSSSILRRIQLGDTVAENEVTELEEYFIETSSYIKAINSGQYMIFVGRKGSGKTANLFRVAEKLKSDKRNYVCVIRPVSYDLLDLMKLIEENIGLSEKGFLFESLWKFLIYTEIANSYFLHLKSLPPHQLSEEENEFWKFIEAKSELILPDFASRMSRAIYDLCNMRSDKPLHGQRIKVSEILHQKFIPVLRKQIGLVLENKHKVCILIDNLDKAWVQGEPIELLSEFIFSLLGVSRKIAEDFQKDNRNIRPVKISLLIFLRSDIFSYLYSEANEADKINYSVLGWDDPELLKRVIEERFLHKLSSNFGPDDVWSDLFVKTIENDRTSQYILERIIPRPRDIIYFCKAALSTAIDRNHTKIFEDDIFTAEKLYSNYAYTSLIAELSPEFEEVESYLFEMIGQNCVVTRDEILELWEKEGLSLDNIERLFEKLVRSLFFGVEVEENQFKFLYDEQGEKIVIHRSKKYQKKSGLVRYKINTPFMKYLEIKNC